MTCSSLPDFRLLKKWGRGKPEVYQAQHVLSGITVADTIVMVYRERAHLARIVTLDDVLQVSFRLQADEKGWRRGIVRGVPSAAHPFRDHCGHEAVYQSQPDAFHQAPD